MSVFGSKQECRACKIRFFSLLSNGLCSVCEHDRQWASMNRFMCNRIHRVLRESSHKRYMAATMAANIFGR